MKTKFKLSGRRVLSALLCLLIRSQAEEVILSELIYS